MARLINYYELKQRILEERDKIPKTLPGAVYEFGIEKPNHHGNSMRGGIRKALRCMEQCKTVDAVPVVRCKDCIHFDERQRTVGNVTGKVYCYGYCYHWDYEQGMSPNQVIGDDFCSYGERRTDV